MRSRLIFISMTALYTLALMSFAYGDVVVVDPEDRRQHFEGWGTSLCWWAVLTGRWSESNREKLIGSIVDPDTGLGYNVFRYNIGGGDHPDHDHLIKGDGGAEVPGFKPSENGPYEWDSDPYQRNIALGIAERGDNLIFEAFSNSPPWWMTKSGCVSGNDDGSDNLKQDYFDDFADYLTEVAKHYREEWGITFRTVEPFNEPSAGWWTSFGDQEGCGFSNDQSRMITELGRSLVQKGLFNTTTVSAADESSIEQALWSLNGYDSTALSYLSQINTHSYSGHNARADLKEAAASRGKRLWQSESGPLHKSDDSPVSLWMADVIIQDLRVMEAEAWVDWQVCDPASSWRSINIDKERETFTYTSRFYMHSAFSRFIRPGSRVISSDNSNTVAALTPGKELVIVALNSSSSDNEYTFDLSGFPGLGTSAEIYRFTLPGSLNQEPEVPVENKQITIDAPSRTVTTCVVSAECDTVPLTSYAKINEGEWQETTEIELNSGDDLILGPQPIDQGMWTWTGPQGFTSDTREIFINDISSGQFGVYTALYTGVPGCTSSVEISVDDEQVSVSDPSYMQKSRDGIILTEKGELDLRGQRWPVEITVYNLRGSLVYREAVTDSRIIPVYSEVSDGIYILRVSDKMGKAVLREKMFFSR